MEWLVLISDMGLVAISEFSNEVRNPDFDAKAPDFLNVPTNSNWFGIGLFSVLWRRVWSVHHIHVNKIQQLLGSCHTCFFLTASSCSFYAELF